MGVINVLHIVLPAEFLFSRQHYQTLPCIDALPVLLPVHNFRAEFRRHDSRQPGRH
jgi:hypothetical protein